MNGRSGARRDRSRSRPRIVSCEIERGSERNLSPRPSHSPETARCRALRALPDSKDEVEVIPPRCPPPHTTSCVDPFASPPSSGRRTPTSGFGSTLDARSSVETLRPPPVARDCPELSARSQLNADLAAVAELRKCGALSLSLMEHISMFLNDKRRELDCAASSQNVDMEVTLEDDSPSLSSRDPRLRRRVVTAPATSAGPTVPPPVTNAPRMTMTTTSADAPTFADALRTTGCNASAQPGQSTAQQAGPQPPAQPPKPRFPPLIVEEFPNWTVHFRALRDLLGHAPNARPLGKGLRFTPCSVEEYRVVQRYLYDLEKTERLSWFSYALPSELSRKVAIRGLPATTSPDEIIEALGELGYQAEYVRPIKARMGRPGCIFFVILTNTPNIVPGIYGVTELLYMQGITIEAWRSKRGPAQCHRCQAFRHSSHGCHRRMACVRCGEEHFARDCPRPLEEPATCANCGGAHPANHTACPQFKREIRNKRAGTVALSQNKPRRPSRTVLPLVPVAVNTVPAEAQASSLMAPANPPTVRGARTKKRGKGKKSRGLVNPTNPEALLSSAPPAVTASAAAKTTAATTAPAHAPESHRNTHISIDRAIDTLKDVLIALREGRDPVQTVLEGMTRLLTSI